MNIVENNKINKYSILAILIALLNVIACVDIYRVYLLGFIEAIFAIFVLIKQRSLDYFIYYLMVISLSIEGIGVYSIKDIKIGPINMYIILLIPIVLKYIQVCLNNKKTKIYLKSTKEFYNYFLYMSLLGAFIGLWNFFVNMEYYGGLVEGVKLYTSEIYLQYIILLGMFWALFVYLTENYSIQKNEFIYGIIAIFIGLSIQIIAAFFSDLYINYTETDTILGVSLNCWFIYFGIFLHKKFPLKSIMKYIYLLLLTFAITILTIYSPSGKNFLFLMLTLSIILWNYIKEASKKKLFIIFFALVSFFAFCNYYSMNETSVLFDYKFLQFRSLINVFDNNWYYNLPPSPRFRVAEFLNIINMYINNPFLLFTGKGILGYFKDSLKLFFYYRDVFSDLEWQYGVFYNPHVAITILLLESGIWGVILIYKLIKHLFSSCNPCLFIGIIWFILFFGYSFGIAVFGSACLVTGLYTKDQIYYEKPRIR